MHTNASVKAMFDQFGDRICGIGLNNGKYIHIGYNGTYALQLEDIEFVTIGGVDMLLLHRVDATRQDPVEYEAYVTTEFIESVNVMSEGYENYRIDPKLVD